MLDWKLCSMLYSVRVLYIRIYGILLVQSPEIKHHVWKTLKFSRVLSNQIRTNVTTFTVLTLYFWFPFFQITSLPCWKQFPLAMLWGFIFVCVITFYSKVMWYFICLDQPSRGRCCLLLITFLIIYDIQLFLPSQKHTASQEKSELKMYYCLSHF